MDDTTAALLRSLDNQREHVLEIVDGLDDDAMRRPVLPTGWNVIGLVQHLALDVERFWFGSVVAGGRHEDGLAEGQSAWTVADDLAPQAVLDLYRSEIERANEIITSTPLTAEPRNWPSFFGSFRLPDLRAIVLHVITETACHAGHLDAARELLDGRTYLVLG
jgi:uncharacterized damage-inducible protein DinB